MRRSRRFSPNPDRIVYPVRVRATRALFPEASGAIPRVSIQFEDAQGAIHQFDLDVKDAAELIEQSTAAYHAILPPLKTSRSGWGA